MSFEELEELYNTIPKYGEFIFTNGDMVWGLKNEIRKLKIKRIFG